MSFLKTISNDNRNGTQRSVVVLKGSAQTIAGDKKKFKINIPTNQICSAFYIVLNESLVGIVTLSFAFLLPFSIVLIIYLWPQQLNFTTKFKR